KNKRTVFFACTVDHSKKIVDAFNKVDSCNLTVEYQMTSNGVNNEWDFWNITNMTIRDFANKGVTILVMDKKDLKEISMGINPLDNIKRAYTNLYFKGLK
ncbi:hypothetical protein LCGC14_2234300, partial [marine sediment metagenome]